MTLNNVEKALMMEHVEGLKQFRQDLSILVQRSQPDMDAIKESLEDLKNQIEIVEHYWVTIQQ